ncbi:MAG: molybdate ABC transporter substrate-binding protein [Magnetococcales bacterium]|nr:molybdate ABC transporter substrate-binding protein [Magnetococcales bacterium]
MLCWLGISCGGAATLTVAVASNLQPAFVDMAEGFRRETGITVDGVYGSSGKLTAQIIHGAPFHLFLSADDHYPALLHKEKHTLQPPGTYAFGRLVVWSMTLQDLTDWPKLLASPEVHHVALANPDTAPYGKQAMKVLAKLGLMDQVQGKLVFGESVAQTNQFIRSGAAQVGLTSRSVVGQNPGGSWQPVEDGLYDPIRQDAVLLVHARTHNMAEAKRFYDYLFSMQSRALLHQHGYQLP